MKNRSLKKFFGVLSMLSLVSSYTITSAATFVVTNGNTSNVSNVVSVNANSGGNTSTGGVGSSGGDAGSASASGGTSNSASGGAGGNGGNGGNGGFITTGRAIGTADVRNDLNSTETVIDASNCACDLLFNETLNTTSSVGASQSATHAASLDQTDQSSYLNANAAQTSDTNLASETSSSSSAPPNSAAFYAASSTDLSSASSADATQVNLDTSLSASESDASASENHNDQTLNYTKTYVPNNDAFVVTNVNNATAANVVGVNADSGANTSTGDNGGIAGNGGSAAVAGPGANAASGGLGGHGGNGGNGGIVATGDSDSLSNVITVSGRTITRITR